MEYLKAATEIGDRYLSMVTDAQEGFLKYMKLVVDAPALLRPDTLPTPSEMLTANFEFAEKLLKTNHAFAERLLTPAPRA
jgi:hypothetical protein